jgi:hypothetical protein
MAFGLSISQLAEPLAALHGLRRFLKKSLDYDANAM